MPKKPPKGEKAKGSLLLPSALNPPDRLGTQYGYETQRFSLIARNPVVKSALELVANGTFWVEGGIQPNSKNDYGENPEFVDLDTQIIEIQQKALDKLGKSKDSPPNIKKTDNLEGVQRSWLKDARVYGFTPSEMIWEVWDSNQMPDIKVKPPWNFNINVDGNDEIKDFDFVGVSGNVEPERILLGIWPFLIHGNYYGESDLLPIEDDVKELEALDRLFMKGAGNSLYRPIINHFSYMDLSEAERDSLKKAFEGLEAGAKLRAPMKKSAEGKIQKTNEYEVLEDQASQYALENTLQILLEKIKSVNRCLGVPDEMGNVTTNVGSLAKAETQFNVFIAKIIQCRKWIEELTQRLIDTIAYYNFDTDKFPSDYHWPVWSFGTVEEDADKIKAEMFVVLKNAGIIKEQHTDWLLEQLNIPPIDPTLEPDVIEEPQNESDIAENTTTEDEEQEPVNENENENEGLEQTTLSFKKSIKRLSKLMKKRKWRLY